MPPGGLGPVCPGPLNIIHLIRHRWRNVRNTMGLRHSGCLSMGRIGWVSGRGPFGPWSRAVCGRIAGRSGARRNRSPQAPRALSLCPPVPVPRWVSSGQHSPHGSRSHNLAPVPGALPPWVRSFVSGSAHGPPATYPQRPTQCPGVSYSVRGPSGPGPELVGECGHGPGPGAPSGDAVARNGPRPDRPAGDETTPRGSDSNSGTNPYRLAGLRLRPPPNEIRGTNFVGGLARCAELD